MVEFKVQCLKVFCCNVDNKSTILLFYSIFRTTSEVSTELYFVEISYVLEMLWLFNHKGADIFGFQILDSFPLCSLLKMLGLINHKEAVQSDEPPFHFKIVEEIFNYRSAAAKS